MATTTEDFTATLIVNDDFGQVTKSEPLKVHKDSLSAEALDLKDPHGMRDFTIGRPQAC